ncbi:MAG TPA: hypothetical protein VNB64_11965 [Solirubrobacteraceae bacterium]|nr:hypothetical protein [Solirubrobacteraceae bacterium]
MTRVSISDREQAEAFLRDQIVPQVSQAPGFVAGYWTNIGGDQGMGITVFESEEAAQQVLDRASDPEGAQPPSEAVRIESMDLAEVVESA